MRNSIYDVRSHGVAKIVIGVTGVQGQLSPDDPPVRGGTYRILFVLRFWRENLKKSNVIFDENTLQKKLQKSQKILFM